MKWGWCTFVAFNIYKVMDYRYIAPEMEVLDIAALQVLCQSQSEQSGTVESVDRLEFDW